MFPECFLPATAALRGAAVVAEVKSARSPANLINWGFRPEVAVVNNGMVNSGLIVA